MVTKKESGEKTASASADSPPHENDEANDSSSCSALIPRPAATFQVEYRRDEQYNLTDEEREKIIRAVDQGGVAIGTETYINRKSLKTLFDSDMQSAVEVTRKAHKSDKKRLGKDVYLSTPETIKELTKRIEQPRSLLQQEKLQQARDNVEDFSNNPKLQRERA